MKRKRIEAWPEPYDEQVALHNAMMVAKALWMIKFEQELAPGIARALMDAGVKFPIAETVEEGR